VIAVLLLPVTAPVNCWVLFVITLVVVGVTVMETPEEALDPQPNAPSAHARASIVDNFHHLIPILPKLLGAFPCGAGIGPRRS
jgi:hypothetical protein